MPWHNIYFFHRRKMPSEGAKKKFRQKSEKYTHCMELNSSKCHMISIHISSLATLAQRSTNGFDKRNTQRVAIWSFENAEIENNVYVLAGQAHGTVFFVHRCHWYTTKNDVEISDYGKYQLTLLRCNLNKKMRNK